jgi:hypothetical protein
MFSYKKCSCKGNNSNCSKCGGDGYEPLKESSLNSSDSGTRKCAKCRDSKVVFDRGRAPCDCQAVDDGNDPNWG